jgi:HSP20 family protein
MANIIRRNQQERAPAVPARGGAVFDPFRIMREMMRFDPFAELEAPLSAQPGFFLPAIDVKETNEAFQFKADLPGVKEQDVEISVTGNRLTLSGQRQEERREENERQHVIETTYGSFSRSFTLPEGIDGDHIQAQMKDGVLTVTVPKRPEVQPRRITIESSHAGEAGQKKS